MEHQILIDEICRRVLAKVQEAGNPKKILLLEEDPDACREWINQSLQNIPAEIIRMQDVLLPDSLEEYDSILLAGISVNAITKAAYGMRDSCFLEQLSNVFLSGRTVYLIRENIEFLRYQESANQNYYHMIEQNLQILVSFGVVIVELAELVKLLTCEKQIPTAVCPPQHQMQGSAMLDKKVITEGDLRNIHADKIKYICIRENAILSDLAKEYVHKHQICLKRNETVGKKVSE